MLGFETKDGSKYIFVGKNQIKGGIFKDTPVEYTELWCLIDATGQIRLTDGQIVRTSEIKRYLYPGDV